MFRGGVHPPEAVCPVSSPLSHPPALEFDLGAVVVLAGPPPCVAPSR